MSETDTMKIRRALSGGGPDPFTKIVMGATGTLLVAVIGTGLLFWHETGTRLALLEERLRALASADQLDHEQSEQLEKLWKAAGQNRDAINDLRDGVNARHRDDPAPQLPRHRWDLD